MSRPFLFLLLAVAATGCSGVGDKVLQDFGVQERPGEYVSGREKVMEELDRVGKGEMNRLNAENRAGTVKFQSSGGVGGKYYRERKVYGDYKPLDAFATSGRRGTTSERGFTGVVEYEYEYYESPHYDSRSQAVNAATTVATGRRDTETVRYDIGANGRWTGGKGR